MFLDCIWAVCPLFIGCLRILQTVIGRNHTEIKKDKNILSTKVP
jgi:hypothetical protein